MRCILVFRLGGPDVLEPMEIPDPQPGPGDLLVRSDAIGVNFIDNYFRTGAYPRMLPYVPGDEGSGLVEAVGADVPDFVPGDRVAWCGAPDSYAQMVVVPAAIAITVPDEVPAPQAASALAQGMTAHYLAYSTYPVQSGDTVLV